MPPTGLSSTAWWPHDGTPYVLVDAPEEGGLEERCWVPVRALDGDEFAEARATGGLLAAALAFIQASPGCDLDFDKDLALALTGEREWHRPRGVPDGQGEWLVHDDAEGDEAEVVGSSWYCPWEPCVPDAPDAVEFYVLELREIQDV